ncbi:hypothetical protein [Paraburkholderia humisilvae]|uniref:Uncharacterized protein n=1 Tax=Paraburkholderia humisilvae TaxID=627669 RepID=A0A6J5DSW3_9BURK|nr:hypothetical protein [Paraburkholderia humisilvae]CAB3756016.1 hypothetical protein LMG29542_02753 [Paraburkholderia humisilvae]
MRGFGTISGLGFRRYFAADNAIGEREQERSVSSGEAFRESTRLARRFRSLLGPKVKVFGSLRQVLAPNCRFRTAESQKVRECGSRNCRRGTVRMKIGLTKGERFQDMLRLRKAVEVRKYGTRFAITYGKSPADGGESDRALTVWLSNGERFREVYRDDVKRIAHRPRGL